jgi:hypothetical protein
VRSGLLEAEECAEPPAERVARRDEPPSHDLCRATARTPRCPHPPDLEHHPQRAAHPRASPPVPHHEAAPRGDGRQALPGHPQPRTVAARVDHRDLQPPGERFRLCGEAERHPRRAPGAACLGAERGERLGEPAPLWPRVEVVPKPHLVTSSADRPRCDRALDLDRSREAVGGHDEDEVRPDGQTAVGSQQRLPLVEGPRQLAQKRCRRAVPGVQAERGNGKGRDGSTVDHGNGSNDDTRVQRGRLPLASCCESISR